MIGRPGFPFGLAFGQLRVGQLYVKSPDIGALAVETAGRTGKFQIRHTRVLRDRALRHKIPLQADDGDRLVGGPHHILVRVPLHALEVSGDRAARRGQAIPAQVAIIEQRLHQKRYAANFKHVFGEITAARLQIRDIGFFFEDFCSVEPVERQVQCNIGRSARGDHAGGSMLVNLVTALPKGIVIRAMRRPFRVLRQMTARQPALDAGLGVHREPVSPTHSCKTREIRRFPSPYRAPSALQPRKQ